MKKFLFTIAGIAMTVCAAVAQNYQENIFGVNAGLNVSSISTEITVGAKSKPGFHIGASYERLLKNNLPLYLETGLQFSLKGYKLDVWGLKEVTNISYLEVPVMVNYKFHLPHEIKLYPSLGLYYGLGLGGKSKAKDVPDYMSKESYKVFGKTGLYKRSDFGMRVSATVEWKRFTLGLGYELGFLNITKDAGSEIDYDYEDDYGYGYGGDVEITINPKVRTGNFFISVGYKF